MDLNGSLVPSRELEEHRRTAKDCGEIVDSTARAGKGA
jgi:hypothetical protein